MKVLEFIHEVLHHQDSMNDSVYIDMRTTGIDMDTDQFTVSSRNGYLQITIDSGDMTLVNQWEYADLVERKNDLEDKVKELESKIEELEDSE